MAGGGYGQIGIAKGLSDFPARIQAERDRIENKKIFNEDRTRQKKLQGRQDDAYSASQSAAQKQQEFDAAAGTLMSSGDAAGVQDFLRKYGQNPNVTITPGQKKGTYDVTIFDENNKPVTTKGEGRDKLGYGMSALMNAESLMAEDRKQGRELDKPKTVASGSDLVTGRGKLLYQNKKEGGDSSNTSKYNPQTAYKNIANQIAKLKGGKYNGITGLYEIGPENSGVISKLSAYGVKFERENPQALGPAEIAEAVLSVENELMNGPISQDDAAAQVEKEIDSKTRLLSSEREEFGPQGKEGYRAQRMSELTTGGQQAGVQKLQNILSNMASNKLMEMRSNINKTGNAPPADFVKKLRPGKLLKTARGEYWTIRDGRPTQVAPPKQAKK